MPDLTEFFNDLIDELKRQSEKDAELFALRFNDDLSQRRARNRKPRTDLMLGMSSNRGAGVLPTALRTFLQLDGSSFEYERYVDISVSEGDWWAGTKVRLGIVEVENDIGEFKGTLSDLLGMQARWKIAVFYEVPDLESRQNDIRTVCSAITASLPPQLSLKSIITGFFRNPWVITALYRMPPINQIPPTIFAGRGRLHQIQRQNRKPKAGSRRSRETRRFSFAAGPM